VTGTKPEGSAANVARQMPAYHFNLVDGAVRLLDPKGVDLPDDAAAMHYAAQLARGFKWIQWSVHVTAENGDVVGCVDRRETRRRRPDDSE
jgi:hypothetical protein